LFDLGLNAGGMESGCVNIEIRECEFIWLILEAQLFGLYLDTWGKEKTKSLFFSSFDLKAFKFSSKSLMEKSMARIKFNLSVAMRKSF
jgi:hypothetical protein